MNRRDLADQIDDLYERLKPPIERMRYCVRPLIPFYNGIGYLEKRAFTAASRLLGIDRKLVRKYARRSREHLSFEAYLERRLKVDIPIPIGPAPRDQFGSVYIARLDGFSTVLKVGFSNHIDERMQSLKRETGIAHCPEEVFAGTYFDEAMEFLARRGDHISGEYFFDRNGDAGDLPPFLNAGFSRDIWALALRKSRQACAHTYANATSSLAQIYLSELMGAPCDR